MPKNIVKIKKEGRNYLIFSKEGMLLELNSKEFEIFDKFGKKRKITEEYGDFLRKLASYGLLEFEDFKTKPNSEKDYDVSLMNHNSNKPLYAAPVLAHLAITSKCNMACKYCSVRKLHGCNEKELSTKDWKRIIDKLAKWGVFQIGFTGGEPTLRKDLPELIKHTYKRGCVCNLTTNGWYLDEKYVQKLVEAGIKQCQISLDSHISGSHEKLRGEGSYLRVLNSIKLLQNKGVAVGIDCVVSKNNIKDIHDFIRWITKKEIPYLTLIKLKKGDLSEEDYRSLAVDYKEYSDLIKTICSRKENKNPNITLDCGSVSNLQAVASKEKLSKLPISGCPLGHHLICSSPQGDMYPCAALLSKDFCLGNMLEDNLEKIWNENVILKNFRLIKQKIHGECKECSRLDLCRGGCRGIVNSFSGDKFASDSTCKLKEVKNENKSR